ncbi:MAG TPA: type II toxin-antitoxin system HicA family toxin [Gemmataceae bacterium]|nr:type II toxin-antitoxin system HicA family toxin [Gemmataceae bacterium]
MKNNVFTFKELDRLLGKLDFTKTIVKGSHVTYEHPSGAQFMFPPRRPNAPVDQKYLIVLRRHLDEFGLMERAEFEKLAHVHV